MLVVTALDYGPVGVPPLQKNLSFEISPGELLHVRGENGAGKSLLARVMLGFAPSAAGRVQNDFGAFRYLPQTQNRTTHLPYSLGDVIGQDTGLGLLDSARWPLAWNKASGGERQRALLTRFFGQAGNLLVLDEPFNHLDDRARELVRAQIREEMKNPAVGALLISHENDPATWLPGVRVKSLTLRRGENA